MNRRHSLVVFAAVLCLGITGGGKSDDAANNTTIAPTGAAGAAPSAKGGSLAPLKGDGADPETKAAVEKEQQNSMAPR